MVATSIGANGEETMVEQMVTVDVHDVNDSAPSAVDQGGTGTVHAMTPDADTPTGYTVTVTDADETAGMYTATVYEGEGDDQAVSERYKAVQDADNPKVFNIVAISGVEIEAGDVSLTVKVTDGSMNDDGEPNEAEGMVSFTVPAAPPPVVPPPGPATTTFELTAGIDNFPGTSGNDLFIARTVDEGPGTGGTRQLVGTITNLDNIQGGDGYDRFDIIYDGNVTIPSTARVSGVEHLKISTTGDVGATGAAAAFTGWGLETIKLGIISGLVNLDAGGAMVMGNETLTGGTGNSITVTGASTVDLTKVDAAAAVNIASGKATTSVNIKGGNTVAVNNGDSVQSSTVEHVGIDGAAGDTTILSDAIASLSLANYNEAVTVTNSAKSAVDIEVTVNEFGVLANPAATPPVVANSGVLTLGGTGAAETVSLVVAGVSNMELTADSAKALNVSGTAGVSLVFTSAAALASIAVSESAGLTADVSGVTTLKTYDGSASSGKQSLTVTDANAVLESVSSGSGDDTLSIGAGAKLETINSGGGKDNLTVTAGTALESIMTGGGDDMLNLSGTHRDDGIEVDLGAGDDMYTATSAGNGKSSISGGSGTDVLATTTAANVQTVDSDDDSIYSGFEILDVTGATGAEEFNLATIGINNVRIRDNDTDGTNNAVSDTSVTLSGATSSTSLNVMGGGATVVYGLRGAADNDNDSVTVNVTAVGGKDDTPGDADADPVVPAATTGQALLGITAADVESIVINSNVMPGGTQAAAAYQNTVTVGGTDAETIRVTGNGRVAVTAPSSVKSVDTTGNSAGADVNASAAAQAVTFTGGNGADTFTGGASADTLSGGGGKDTLNGGGEADTIRGGAGDDTIDGGTGADVITGGAGADTITGGDDQDVINYSSRSESRISFDDDDAASGIDVIIGFSLTAGSEDVISLSRGIGVSDSDLTGATALLDKGAVPTEQGDGANPVDDLHDFIGDGVDFFEGANGDKALAVASGDYGGNAGVFLFIDANGNGGFEAGTDMVIFLQGSTLADVTAADLTAIIDIV